MERKMNEKLGRDMKHASDKKITFAKKILDCNSCYLDVSNLYLNQILESNRFKDAKEKICDEHQGDFDLFIKYLSREEGYKKLVK